MSAVETSVPGLREQKKAEARERILDEFIALLVDGAADLSHDAVAARAGVGRRTVYRYFPDREALMEAALLRVRSLAGPGVALPTSAEDIVASLESVIELQIIMGLPGDTPQGFRETVERARAMPVQVRVYYCLVLPDALLTRGDPDFDVKFDPHDMKMLSCKGWSAEDLQREREYMNNLAKAEGGSTGPFWWHLPAKRKPLIGKHKPDYAQYQQHRPSDQGQPRPDNRVRLPQVKL